MRRWFGFPETVNDKAARTVAAGVIAMAVVYLVTGSGWVLVPLWYGFAARVAAGPRYSPLGRLAVHVVAPRLGAPKLVPGPPKRFAQGIGLACATAIVVGHLTGATPVAVAVSVMLVAAASLEAVLGFCLGCTIFAGLMRLGVIPASVCQECSDLSRRLAAARSATASASS
ncbi:MAG: DUF4395 domain-containing protein [Acidimicrobiales bacterium]